VDVDREVTACLRHQIRWTNLRGTGHGVSADLVRRRSAACRRAKFDETGQRWVFRLLSFLA
jgi:hypothetical protein